MKINFDDKSPVYLQIIDFIKSAIITGKFDKGGKLPSVRDLAFNLKVNPNTISKVYQELEREGVTFTKRGMGTFIKEDDEMIENIKEEKAKIIIDEFIKGVKELGFSKEKVIKIIEEEFKES